MQVEWDAEERRIAYDQARALQAHDPDAAAYLLAHLDVPSDEPMPPPSQHEPYNPIRLYALMAKVYRFSHSEMDSLHFPTFFAYIREAALMAEEENRQAHAPPVPYEPPEAHSHRFR